MKPSKESPHYALAGSWPDNFQPPPPLIPFSESGYRLDRAQILLELLKEEFWQNHKPYMRGEELVTILMVAREDLENDGQLSRDDDSDYPCIPSQTENLKNIAQSCMHYMLHLDPDNLEDPRWQHAIFVPLEEQPPLDGLYAQDVLDHDVINQSIIYRNRFKTLECLRPVRRSRSTVKAEEAKCWNRDKGTCVVTGKPLGHIFYFIPFTWNDTVEHMNATGEIVGGIFDLGVDLFDGPTPPCNVSALGGSHKAWNMLSVDLVLRRYLKDGLCAFQWLTTDPAPNGEVRVTLQFHWMPLLELRWGQRMNINRRGSRNDFRKLVEDIKNFDHGPQITHKYGTVMDKQGKPLRSGQLIHIMMSKQDAEQCRDAVKVHWGCVVYTALCGAAGRPWLLAAEVEDESREEWINW
ncbi:uncharacterized protein B0J16DRAFT_410226 [Fusarium flagelliforme]|uniref:uncharacterized protein n=1 Tax=Fusarium flagelliforme TaxID=2675880 RepID=UPI001E8D8761|nr:uncharacterized protein B0J16DRAFT_410226 [Fusarium flagelliforme]KAH7198752.1 hypothetical protein B0J16DRAFT_410226 [Fusarium flagelliforme]